MFAPTLQLSVFIFLSNLDQPSQNKLKRFSKKVKPQSTHILSNHHGPLAI